MKCPSCGFEDEGRFCKQCGSPLVSEAKANYLGTPKYTGITIPPPSASQGFTADDIEEIGLHDDDPHMASGEMSGGAESTGNSFGIFMIMILVVAILIFVVKMVGQQ